MADPFDALGRTDPPIAPRPAFAAELRARLRDAIRPPDDTTTDEEHPVTDTTSTRTTLSPYLCVDGARRALDWYVENLGGRVESDPIEMDDGRIGHAEVRFGDTVLMFSDEFPEIGVRAPSTYGGTPVALVLEVPDVDRTFAAALAAGATTERPVAEQEYGARAGWLVDPFGHRWNLNTPRPD